MEDIQNAAVMEITADWLESIVPQYIMRQAIMQHA